VVANDVFSLALVRFVTGICDAMQDTRNGKQSMLQIAVALQLPVELVEARHAISHKELPSLAQLRLAAQLGMKWLWSWYWTKLDHFVKITTSEEEEPAEGDLLAKRAAMQAILKRYLAERRAEVKKRAKTLVAGRSACQAVSNDCGNGLPSRKILLSLLVDDRMIIPSDKR
jgi:ribosomal biogenesis protein LAS1